MEWTKRPDKNFYQNKRTNLVAWYVDDCNEAKTIREDYVSYLENYVKVDIYGKCGNQECHPQQVTIFSNIHGRVGGQLGGTNFPPGKIFRKS